MASWSTLLCRQVDVQFCDARTGLARLGGFGHCQDDGRGLPGAMGREKRRGLELVKVRSQGVNPDLWSWESAPFTPLTGGWKRSPCKVPGLRKLGLCGVRTPVEN